MSESASKTEPTIRVRLQHSHTLKEGWRLSETTVEYTGERVDWTFLQQELREAHRVGTVEAIHRAAADSGAE